MSETTEDVAAFGADQWLYCAEHLRTHATGWCTVGADRKLGLGIRVSPHGDRGYAAASAKCRLLGLTLYSDTLAAK